MGNLAVQRMAAETLVGVGQDIVPRSEPHTAPDAEVIVQFNSRHSRQEQQMNRISDNSCSRAGPQDTAGLRSRPRSHPAGNRGRHPRDAEARSSPYLPSSHVQHLSQVVIAKSGSRCRWLCRQIQRLTKERDTFKSLAEEREERLQAWERTLQLMPTRTPVV